MNLPSREGGHSGRQWRTGCPGKRPAPEEERVEGPGA